MTLPPSPPLTPLRRMSVQNVPVCTFKTSPCVPAPRARVLQHVHVVPGLFVPDGRKEGVYHLLNESSLLQR